MPTCVTSFGLSFFVSKNSSDPTASVDVAQALCCSRAVRGRLMPAWPYAHCVKSEQSVFFGNPSGGSLYGVPIFVRAASTTFFPCAGVRACADTALTANRASTASRDTNENFVIGTPLRFTEPSTCYV